jgi:GNAT superfamily N-acetyltransferase
MIRDRTAGDLDECVALLAAVHAADGFPMHWPGDPRRWLSPRGLRRAWVAIGAPAHGAASEPAVGTAGIVGHVVVRDDRFGAGPSVAELGRLFVHPAVRRQRVAVRLLDHAREWADREGLTLVLEVAATDGSAAIELYEATGWQHTETILADWTGPAGEAVNLHRYRLG